MVSKVIVFGDSFLYGHETNYTDFVEHPDFKKNFKKAVGIKWQLAQDGRLNSSTSEQRAKWFNFLIELDPQQKQNCNNNSIGGYLADELHVSNYLNFASVGSSNNFILYRVMKHQKEITKNTLVVCGITSPLRDTKYEPVDQGVPDTAFIGLEDVDLTSRVIQTVAYTQAIKQIVESCGGRIVFVDPFGNFAQDEYHSGEAWDYIKHKANENYQHDNVLKIIDELNCENFAPGLSSLYNWTQENNIAMFTPGGHYSKDIYEQYTKEYLVPYLRDKHVI